MKLNEFNRLNTTTSNNTKITALDENTKKTLLYGYTTDRNTHHVYQEDGELNLIVYNYNNEVIKHISGYEIEIADLIPNKRLYPERCDFDFCEKLISKGSILPFSRFNEEVAEKVKDTNFYGQSLEDFGISKENTFKP